MARQERTAWVEADAEASPEPQAIKKVADEISAGAAGGLSRAVPGSAGAAATASATPSLPTTGDPTAHGGGAEPEPRGAGGGRQGESGPRDGAHSPHHQE